MKNVFFIVMFFCCVQLLNAQNDSIVPVVGRGSNTTDFPELSVQPQYIGGIEAIGRTVAMSYNYPREAIDEGITGTIMVEFIVDEEGNVADVTIKKGVCVPCDQEALRVVKLLRKFEPGLDQHGKPVKARYSLPITLNLAE